MPTTPCRLVLRRWGRSLVGASRGSRLVERATLITSRSTVTRGPGGRGRGLIATRATVRRITTGSTRSLVRTWVVLSRGRSTVLSRRGWIALGRGRVLAWGWIPSMRRWSTIRSRALLTNRAGVLLALWGIILLGMSLGVWVIRRIGGIWRRARSVVSKVLLLRLSTAMLALILDLLVHI